MTARELEVGDTAPDFPAKLGNDVNSLYDMLKTGPVVLYFYPKDFTSGCTTEACEFRDSLPLFVKKGATVIGVSSDSEEKHARFAERYGLRFPLISDGERKIREMFGVRPTLGFIPGRTTFVISKQGKIIGKFSSQTQPKKHVEEALSKL